MTTLVSVLAALVVVALLVVRRARPRPVAEESFRKPLVLTVVGLFLLHDVVLDARRRRSSSSRAASPSDWARPAGPWSGWAGPAGSS